MIQAIKKALPVLMTALLLSGCTTSGVENSGSADNVYSADSGESADSENKEVAAAPYTLEQMKAGGSITVRSLVGHGRFPYLGYPRRYSAEDNRKIDEALELAGVSEIADKTLNELSGGQQRAHIAMTLAQDTDIILLDEPLTYLDISHQLHIMQLIVRLKAMGKTIIAVMHDLNLALSYSDKIAVMKDGEILALALRVR